MCKVKGCDRKSMYKEKDLCQMHYFRLMRNGTTDLVRKRKYRTENPAGYQVLYEPNHPLAQSGGYVYEHRKVAYEKYGENLPDCEMCGASCSWQIYTTHIDHIDRNVRNNSPENLRPLCNSCNSQRDVNFTERARAVNIDVNGVVKTVSEWVRSEGVTVIAKTIKERLARGWSAYDAVYTPSRTIKRVKSA